MKYFFDAAYAPTAVAAARISQNNGGAGWAVYIGGARNGGVGWTPDVVRNMALAGVQDFLPIWVGPQILPAQNINDASLLSYGKGGLDAQSVIALLKIFGFGVGCGVAIDIEETTISGSVGGAAAYVAGFCDTLRSSSSHTPLVYCPASAIGILPGASYYWAADWVQNDPPDMAHLRSATLSNNVLLWQYWGNTTVEGVEVDRSIITRPAWPEGLFRYPTVVSNTPEDYAAAAWVAKVNAMTFAIPVTKCLATQRAVEHFVTSSLKKKSQ